MARFQIFARTRGAKDRKIIDVDVLDDPADRRVRRALRQESDVLVIDTTATTDPRARWTVLLAGRTDPEPTPDGE